MGAQPAPGTEHKRWINPARIAMCNALTEATQSASNIITSTHTQTQIEPWFGDGLEWT